MPFESKKQAALFYAAANKPGGIKGLSKNVAQKFIKDTHHQKISELPEKKRFTKLSSYLNKKNQGEK